ncbi:MAG TPA: permease-like cell division protein FtsX [Kineosporiaceae bacterium]|nr:permease-like cell division protein FtsX [Kineosporiaceae bacterium]
MRFQFILSEIGIGLRRNLSMTISVVLVTAVSLFLLGFGILAQKQVGLMKDYWYDRVQVSIFLCGGDSTAATCSSGPVTQAQKDQVVADLNSPQMAPYVEKVYYESKQQALDHFKQQFKNSVLANNVTVNDMPESYRVKLKDPKKYQTVAQLFAGRQGVEEVQDQNQVLDRLFALLNGLAMGAWAIALVTLSTAVLLVATTIRLSAFTRRRETGIMRLVGASNLVIQLPFILESMIAASLGALLACLALGPVVQFVIRDWLAGKLPFIEQWVGMNPLDFGQAGNALYVIPILFATGLVIAGVSSFVSLLRYLRV